MSILHISLVGQFRIVDCEQRDCLPRGSYERAILAVLIQSPGNSVNRQWLRELLWFDRSEEQRKTSLRQALARIRRSFAHNRDILQSTKLDVWLDSRRLKFENSTAVGESVAHPNDYLQGISIRGAPFDNWLCNARQSLCREAQDEARASALERPAVDESAFASRRVDTDRSERDRTASPVEASTRIGLLIRSRGGCCDRGLDHAQCLVESVAAVAFSSGLVDVYREDYQAATNRDAGLQQMTLSINRWGTGRHLGIACVLHASDTGRQLWQFHFAESHCRSPGFLYKAQECAYRLCEYLIVECNRRRCDSAITASAVASVMHGLLLPGSMDASQMLTGAAAAIEADNRGMHHALRAAALSYQFGERGSNNAQPVLEELRYSLNFAMQLEPDNPTVLALVGHANTFVLQDIATGLELTKRSVELAPGYALAHLLCSTSQYYAGRVQESLVQASHGWTVGRQSIGRPLFALGLSRALYTSGRIDESLALCEQAARAISSFRPVWDMMLAGYAAVGNAQGAVDVVRKIRSIDPKFGIDSVISNQYSILCQSTKERIVDAVRNGD